MSLDSLDTFPREAERFGLGSLGRASLVYSLGGLAYKGVALITIPILARILSPGQLGVLDLAAVLASTVGLLAVLGTDQAVAFHEPRSRAPTGLWSSALTVAVAAGGLLAVIGALLRDPIAVVLTGDPDNGSVIAAAGVYGLVLAISTLALNAVRLRGTPVAYAISSFVIVVAEMSVALAAVWIVPGAVSLMVFGWAFGAIVVALPVLWRFVPRLGAPVARDVRLLVTFGAPLVPAAVAWLVGDAWIRGTLARELDLSALGEYGIAYRIASVLGLVVTGFGVAWYPFLFRSAEDRVALRASRALSLVLLAFAAIGVALTAFSPEIIAVVAGSEYANARHAIGPLVGGMVALGAFVLVGAVVGASGSTRAIAVAALAGAGIQVVASAVLVSPLGLLGAGLASGVGYVAAALLLVANQASVVRGRDGIVTAGAVTVAVIGLAVGSAATDSPIAVRALTVLAVSAITLVAALAILRQGGWADPLR